MEQYIPKSVVVAELERLYNLEYNNTSNLSCGKKIMLRHILLFLDTIEVKEADLEKRDIKNAFKADYELGIQEAQKRETKLLKVRGYLVRDKDDYTAIYAEKPYRGKTEWVDACLPKNHSETSCLMTINDARLVPDLEFEDEPVEVEVTLKRV